MKPPRPPAVDRGDQLLAQAKTSRAMASGLVARWLGTNDFPDHLLESITRDRAFLMETVYGVARRRRSLEWALRPYVAHPPAISVQACLLVGAYQLLFMDHVPAHAAVNDAVEAAKLAGGPGVAGFANGVMRRLAEQAARIRQELGTQPLGVRESFPDVLVHRWEAQFGAVRAEALCRWHNERPRTVIRLDRRRAKVPEFLARLQAAGMTGAAAHPFRPDACIQLPAGVSVAEVPGFDEGLWMVQDPATLVAVELLAARRGDRVLDACAAPGGKAMCIAEALDGSGELVALDVHADRLGPLQENVARMRAPVRIVQADARDPKLPEQIGRELFDRILVDVPCTNTGVFRRRPDARWRFSAARLTAQARVQKAILENLVRLLKPGGAMVYSTCSLEPEENVQLVGRWMRRHPDLKSERQVILFPPDTQTDGAFAALLKKG